MAETNKPNQVKLIASNPGARSDYFFEEIVEGGLVLKGTEVKSLRNQTPNIKDSFVEVVSSKSGFEAWLVNAHFSPYSHGNIWNHESLRRRKVLLHKYQLAHIHGSLVQKGMSLIPLRMYFKNGKAKIELGLGRGKKKYDKRQDLKKKTANREIEAALKRR